MAFGAGWWYLGRLTVLQVYYINGVMQTPPFGVPAGTSRESTYEALRQDVAERLKNVCAAWSDEDFQAIVEKVTQTALKYIQSDLVVRGNRPDSPDQRDNQA